MNFIYCTFHFADGSKATFYSEGYPSGLKRGQKIAEERNTRITGYEMMVKENETMTAYELFKQCVDENHSINWGWVRRLRRTISDKKLMDMCREEIYYISPQGTSKQKIGRAARLLYKYLFNRRAKK